MARPLRIEFPGAVHHVTSRGDRRESIFIDDEDRHVLLAVVAAALLTGLRQRIYLGDEAFVDRMQGLAAARNSTDPDVPKTQRRKARSLAQWMSSCETREEALYRAHTEGTLSMTAIAHELGLSVSRVSRLIARAEEAKSKA